LSVAETTAFGTVCPHCIEAFAGTPTSVGAILSLEVNVLEADTELPQSSTAVQVMVRTMLQPEATSVKVEVTGTEASQLSEADTPKSAPAGSAEQATVVFEGKLLNEGC
jgi:hypothetical protein